MSSYLQHDIQKVTCTFADVSEICTLNKIREINFYIVIPSLFLGDVKVLGEMKKYCVTYIFEETEWTIVIHYYQE